MSLKILDGHESKECCTGVDTLLCLVKNKMVKNFQQDNEQ